MSSKIRCHMFIGIPASGKSTLAQKIAPTINAEILSTDKIREELYGDETVQGSWNKIESILHERLRDHIKNNKTVILDATFAMRPWRLSITQNIIFDKEVEWIGWWFNTPIDVCLEWNQLRERKVHNSVIKRFNAALSNKNFAPDLSEGFAALINIDPTVIENIEDELKKKLLQIDNRIKLRKNRENKKELHGYSKLLDFERLLYLIQLLINFPGIKASDKKTKLEMEEICNPLPEGSLAYKASCFIDQLRGSCYSNILEIENDLKWLEKNGFIDQTKSAIAIEPPIKKLNADYQNGGLSRYSDKDAFIRIMSLIRYILHNPFDDSRSEEDKIKNITLHDYYISKLDNIYFKGDRDTLRKDIEKVLTPYGFRKKNDNVRHGYGLGAAVVSRNRLEDLFQIVDQARNKLSDPTVSSVSDELKERFKWAGFDLNNYPVRSFANKSVIDPALTKSESIANEKNTEKIENSIKEGNLIELEFFKGSGKFEKSEYTETKWVWPIQLLFNNIGWYLAYEEKVMGDKPGLLKTERIDRISQRRIDPSKRRDRDQRDKALKKIKKLISISGSIYFGNEIKEQENIISASDNKLEGLLKKIRFRTTENIYKFLREELQRYPINQIKFPKKIKREFSDNWKDPDTGNFTLDILEGDSHPYPIEILLPLWTINDDIDFKRWIIGFRDEIIVESPSNFVKDMSEKIKKLGLMYQKIES